MAQQVYYNPLLPVVDDMRRVVPVWDEFFRRLVGVVNQLSGEAAFSISRGTYTELNALTGLTSGALAFETTTGHLLRWTGSAWEFAPGDNGSGYFQHFAVTPEATGWVLCNGGATSYLTIGATLALAAYTTPDATGTGRYLKSAAAYGGAAAAGGTTASDGTHSHTDPDTSGVVTGTPISVDTNLDGSTDQVLPQTFVDTHTHGGGGATSSDGAHTHGPGSIDLARVEAPLYFRR